jgi:hypothetical protein
LRDSAAALAGEALRATAIVAAAETRAFETGMRIASTAMPARPFVEAFRTVLDRRSNPFSRSWRTTLRHIRLGIESIPARLRGSRPPKEGAAAISLAEIERDELVKGWPQFWEELVRDLGREARHPARQSASPAVIAQLDRDPTTAAADAQARAEGALRMAPAEVGEFQSAW